jgi:hypothetical protein
LCLGKPIFSSPTPFSTGYIIGCVDTSVYAVSHGGLQVFNCILQFLLNSLQFLLNGLLYFLLHIILLNPIMLFIQQVLINLPEMPLLSQYLTCHFPNISRQHIVSLSTLHLYCTLKSFFQHHSSIIPLRSLHISNLFPVVAVQDSGAGVFHAMSRNWRPLPRHYHHHGS